MQPFFPPGSNRGGGPNPNPNPNQLLFPPMANPNFPPQQFPNFPNFANPNFFPMMNPQQQQQQQQMAAMQLLNQAAAANAQLQNMQNLGFLAAAMQNQFGAPRLPSGPPMNMNAGGGFNGFGGGAGYPQVGANFFRPNTNVNYAVSGANGTSNFVPGNSGGRNFAGNQNRGGKSGPSDMMFQKGRFNTGRNENNGSLFKGTRGTGYAKSFTGRGGKGRVNFNEGKSDLANSSKPAPKVRRRPPIMYDANEVKQWRQSRRRNYPTSANIKKKMDSKILNSKNTDEEKKLRRQQLKEILAKQHELGVEVAEIPPDYLCEHDGQASEKRNSWNTGRQRGHFSNKRGRHGCRDFRSRRQKVQNDTTVGDAAMVESREPTLLQKLLSADVRMDKHKLLQAFRFIVLNNFFKDWPEKPLEFPSVTVKQDIVIEENYDQKESSSTDGEDELSDDE